MTSRDFRPLSPVRLLPWLNLADRALGHGSNVYRQLATMPPEATVKRTVSDLSKRTGHIKARKTQEMTFLTEPGMWMLLMRSRSAQAAALRRWLCGEVLPTIHRFGCYEPALVNAEGAVAATAVYRRYRQIRASLLEADAEKLAESGLLTIAAFREVHAIPARDALAFARTVQHQAGLARVKPRRFFRQGGMRCAWPVAVLLVALVNFQPRLALTWTLPA